MPRRYVGAGTNNHRNSIPSSSLREQDISLCACQLSSQGFPCDDISNSMVNRITPLRLARSQLLSRPITARVFFFSRVSGKWKSTNRHYRNRGKNSFFSVKIQLTYRGICDNLYSPGNMEQTTRIHDIQHEKKLLN